MTKIAIHYRENSFSDVWIRYCEKNNVPYKIVNCYENNIIDQLQDCHALAWHFHHASSVDYLMAKQLMFSLQDTEIALFPDFLTSWHFNDKIAQKYLFEAIGVPLVNTSVFFNEEEALNWVQGATFPKIFKLRNGASSQNVKLVKDKKQAKQLVKKSFSRGFRQYPPISNIKERYRKYMNGSSTLWDLMKGFIRLGYTTNFDRVAGNEIGYVYFQDFIPGCDYDVRVVVIGEKAFAIKRIVRENDFRASGSGKKYMGRDLFNEDLIKLSFEITEKLKAQCVAYDFIYDGNSPKIVEISYGFTTSEVPGYWDKDLNWHAGVVKPQEWMIENLLKSTVIA